MSTKVTPEDLALALPINPRDLKLNREAEMSHNSRWWHNNDPVKTTFLNALSLALPTGEMLAIDAVRCFRDIADPALQVQIAAFIEQERTHTREHVVLNRLVERAGYDVSQENAYMARRLYAGRMRPPITKIAVATTLEHITASLAHGILSDPKHLAGVPKDIADLWKWHFLEEIEHKSVAFDTYVAATKDWSKFKRWYVRCLTMIPMTYYFWKAVNVYMVSLFRQDGINNWRTWLRVFKCYLIEPGWMRIIFWEYCKIYSPRFHPWNDDDRAFIAKIDKELERPKEEALSAVET